MKLLLHICCAPCLIYPSGRLKAKGVSFTGFFFNPNIHTFSEYNKRKNTVEDFSQSANIEIIYAEYVPIEFFNAVSAKENKPERCQICWSLRLKKTAQAAKKEGFNTFSTTLLVSPYQDHEALKEIGSRIAQDEGIDFYYEDFRPGFREALNTAKAQGLYYQKFCGCVYSEIERYKNKMLRINAASVINKVT